jgi:hypothetical protein
MSNWKHKEMSENELKELVRDVYDGKLFTTIQCPSNMVTIVFMTLLFLDNSPSIPSKTDDNQMNRKNKLIYIEEKLSYEKETPERKEFIKNIGMVYSTLADAAPRSINGYPIFYNTKIVSIEDTKKFTDIYQKYVKMREDFEKEWK